MKKGVALLVLLHLLGSAAARAQDATGAAGARATLRAVPVSGTITLDGRLAEEAWAGTPAAEGFVQRAPQPGAPATRETQVRVLYDSRAVYVGVRLFDSPDSIAAQLGRRDATGIYADWFSVLLDSDDDRRTAFVFGTTPRKVTRDFILYEDGRTDYTWDAVWEVETAVDSLGWTAELRIPLSQLRYSRGREEWGLNFQRVIARREETSYWSPIAPQASGFVSRFGALGGMGEVAAPRRLELQPYAMNRLTRAPGDARDPFHSPNELSVSGGLDFEYGVTPDLTLTGTVNPDFGQVEADPAQVNLTAFETFFPEKRPFFVEDADIFDFVFGGTAGQLFYSRRIGGGVRGSLPSDAAFRDVPEAPTILGAAKLSGKTAGGWSVGLLNATTGAAEARYATAGGERGTVQVEPLTNYAVGRTIKDFRGGKSAFGGVFTATHRDLDGTGPLRLLPVAAYAGGVDGRHRFGGGDYEVQGFLMGSHVRGEEAAMLRLQREAGHNFQRPDAGHLEVDSARTSLSGVIGDVEISKIGGGHWRWEVVGRAWTPGFEVDDVGFQQQADAIYQFAQVEYLGFRPGRLFRNWSANLFQRAQWTFGGERVETLGTLIARAQLHNYWGGVLNLERDQPALDVAALRGGPALAVPGETRATLALYSDQRKPFRAVLQGTLGVSDEAGGRLVSVGSTLELRPSPRAQVSLRPSVSWTENPAQYVRQIPSGSTIRYVFAHLDQTTVALTTRLSYSFSPELTFEFYGQPFISALDYSGFMDVANPRAERFGDRFRSAPYTANPDLNVKQFRSNSVLRWEYRPGSTLFVIWNSGLRDNRPDGSFALFRDADRLFDAPGTNVLLVKLTYWFGL